MRSFVNSKSRRAPTLNSSKLWKPPTVRYADRYLGSDAVTICFFGDGTANRGQFHEALNYAAVSRTPVIFFCENNGVALSVPASASTAVRDIADRAAGYGIPGVVVDGSDNFATRYLSNDVCVFARKPNVYGSVFRFEGQATVFAPHLGGPCYRCLFPEPPPAESVPNCAQAGVLGVLPGIIGMLQAIETIKLILGIGDLLIGRLLHFDALKVHFRELKLRRDPQCPVCGENPTISAPIDYDQFCGAREEGMVPSISVQELKRRMDAIEDFELIDVREPFEFEIARINGAKLIPLGEIAERADELQREQPVVVHCHSGRRSAQAVRLLQQRGFANVYNLEGGIGAWSDLIDPSVPKY